MNNCIVYLTAARLRSILLFLSLIFCTSKVSAQDSASFRIHYVINSPVVDTSVVDNSARLSDIRSFLETISNDSLIRVSRVRFRGTASPDGGYEFNQWLSANRLRTFKELINSYRHIPDSIIEANVSDIPWDEFRKAVDESDIPHRDEVLAIIDEEQRIVPWSNNRHIDARLLKLKELHNGEVWETLKEPILRDLRYGEAVFEYYRVLSPEITPPASVQALVEPRLPELSFQYVDAPADVWMPRLHLKTNAIGLALLSANLAVEVDVARHWSVTLPVYYCGADWFKSTIKFRNFTVQPEARYWFRHSDNDGFFLGAHFGMSYFNFAFDGKYRYQDYRGCTPALGGGLSTGYRIPISRNHRWRMEFAVGAGIYDLDYSLFSNTTDVKDGQWMERRQKTYIGLDQAAITLAYSFDLKKKGGKR